MSQNNSQNPYSMRNQFSPDQMKVVADTFMDMSYIDHFYLKHRLLKVKAPPIFYYDITNILDDDIFIEGYENGGNYIESIKAVSENVSLPFHSPDTGLLLVEGWPYAVENLPPLQQNDDGESDVNMAIVVEYKLVTKHDKKEGGDFYRRSKWVVNTHGIMYGMGFTTFEYPLPYGVNNLIDENGQIIATTILRYEYNLENGSTKITEADPRDENVTDGVIYTIMGVHAMAMRTVSYLNTEHSVLVMQPDAEISKTFSDAVGFPLSPMNYLAFLDEDQIYQDVIENITSSFLEAHPFDSQNQMPSIFKGDPGVLH